MFSAEWWLDKLYLAPGILFGLVVHEFCHAYAAYRLGDVTAARAGRLTFNPLKHLDLLGMAALFLARIGWAKPVPVDPRNFRKPRQGILITSAAGPFANLVVAAVLGVALGALVAGAVKTAAPFGDPYLRLLFLVLFNAVYINVVLALFNLIPIPPLDGSNVLWAILPPRFAASYGRFLSRYGHGVLLGFFVIIFFGPSVGLPIFRWLIVPPTAFLVGLFTGYSLQELSWLYNSLFGA